jgi:hypothetical protein
VGDTILINYSINKQFIMKKKTIKKQDKVKVEDLEIEEKLKKEKENGSKKGESEEIESRKEEIDVEEGDEGEGSGEDDGGTQNSTETDESNGGGDGSEKGDGDEGEKSAEKALPNDEDEDSESKGEHSESKGEGESATVPDKGEKSDEIGSEQGSPDQGKGPDEQLREEADSKSMAEDLGIQSEPGDVSNVLMSEAPSAEDLKGEKSDDILNPEKIAGIVTQSINAGVASNGSIGEVQTNVTDDLMGAMMGEGTVSVSTMFEPRSKVTAISVDLNGESYVIFTVGSGVIFKSGTEDPVAVRTLLSKLGYKPVGVSSNSKNFFKNVSKR